MSFLTLEDINTTIFNNQDCYWYTIDLGDITEGTEDLNEVKIDFCKVTRTKTEQGYDFFVKVDTSNWIGYIYSIFTSDFVSIPIVQNGGLKFITPESIPTLKLYFYLGNQEWLGFTQREILNPVLDLNLKELGEEQTIRGRLWQTDNITTVSLVLNQGYNKIMKNNSPWGYVLVKLVKTDFQFNCNQVLTNGKVNTVPLGVDTDYKPNGDLIGDYTPEISVFYGDETLPVVWNPTINDYTFDIDLTNREKETDVILTVFVDNNEVLNQTSRDVRLHTRFENIDSITKLNTLFQNGGIGRLDANLVLTNDLTVSNDVYLLGNHYNINMAENKFIISENKTFKCEQTGFSNGENTIQQKLDSKVELTECSFTNCTGLGSVIDCQIDIKNLTNPTDFTTNLEKCVFDSCDMMILHGGELSVTNCVVNGANTKVDNPNYPFFLYQTDGTARILQSEFNFIQDTDIDEDIEFNSCIFVCGETAEINGYNHTELQKNNLTQFLEIQRNTSKIDVSYYYPPIEDYITLQSNNGFCHAVSNVDYVFKTNVTPERR